MKKIITSTFIVLSLTSLAQESFNDIHKLVESKKFIEAVPKLKKFINNDPKHVSANYDLANCYSQLFSKTVETQNANIKIQNTIKWQDEDYLNNILLWKQCVGYNDSAVMFYKQTSEFMNVKFLTLDLRYPEFADVTSACSILKKVTCAREYINKFISNLESSSVSNKAAMFNVEKNYDEFKSKKIKQTEINDIKIDESSNTGKFAGDYEILLDEFNEAGGTYHFYFETKYTGKCEVGSSGGVLKNILISEEGNKFSFLHENELNYGTFEIIGDTVFMRVNTKLGKINLFKVEKKASLIGKYFIGYAGANYRQYEFKKNMKDEYSGEYNEFIGKEISLKITSIKVNELNKTFECVINAKKCKGSFTSESLTIDDGESETYDRIKL